MKKLLSILSAFLIAASSATSVIACDTDVKRFNTPGIADAIKNLIIAEIANNNSKYGSLTFGDVFNKNSDTSKLAVRLINQMVSQYFYDTNQEQWAQWANEVQGGTGSISKDVINVKIFANWVEQIATDKLYNEYLKDFANNDFLEYKLIGGPNSTSSDTTRYGIDGQTDDWHIAGTTSTKIDKDGKPITENFYFDTTDTSYLQTLIQNNNTDEIKKQLKNHFKTYWMQNEVNSVLDKIIGQVYLNQSLVYIKNNYNGTKKESYIYTDTDRSSLLKNWQNWETDGNDIKTNFKMVWQIKIENTDGGATINSINKQINDDKDKINNGTNLTEADIESYFKSATLIKNNLDKNGVDPIWGIPHFQGFAAYDKSGNLINKDDFVADGSYSPKVLETNTAGFMKSASSSSPNYAFYDANKTYAYFAFVLPIYAVDLLNNISINFGADPKDSTKIMKANVQLKTKNGNSLDWGQLPNKNNQSVKFLHDYGTNPDSRGQDAGLGTYANDNKTKIYDDNGNITSGIDSTRLGLIRWASYAFSQSDDIVKTAKTSLFSIAFDYDKNNLYSNNLMTDIGQYIQDDQTDK